MTKNKRSARFSVGALLFLIAALVVSYAALFAIELVALVGVKAALASPTGVAVATAVSSVLCTFATINLILSIRQDTPSK